MGGGGFHQEQKLPKEGGWFHQEQKLPKEGGGVSIKNKSYLKRGGGGGWFHQEQMEEAPRESTYRICPNRRALRECGP